MFHVSSTVNMIPRIMIQTTSGWCVFCFLPARHEILHSSMRHKWRHKVFERRQTPSWYDFFTSQSKHVTFSLILAHSSTNILWNFETPFDSCFSIAGFRPWSVAYQAYLNQHQREAPSPHLPALIAAASHVVRGCSCTDAPEGLQAGPAGWCLSWQIQHFVAFFAQQVLWRNRSLSWKAKFQYVHFFFHIPQRPSIM